LIISGVINAFEEGECGWVRRIRRLHVANVLNRNVAMTNDVAILVQVLGRGIVVSCWVGEETGAEVLCLHLDVERRVRGNLYAHFRVGNHGRDHVGLGGDLAHGNAVAGPCLDLHAVGDFLALAEVDKIRIIASRQVSACNDN
jgi:hypothetical protein